MQIEVFEQKSNKPGLKKGWYWRTRNKGRVTGGNEQHPDKAKAIRGAKAHVISCVKPVTELYIPNFTDPKWDEKLEAFVIKWTGLMRTDLP